MLIEARGYGYERLDGNDRGVSRQQAIDRFSNPQVMTSYGLSDDLSDGLSDGSSDYLPMASDGSSDGSADYLPMRSRSRSSSSSRHVRAAWGLI